MPAPRRRCDTGKGQEEKTEQVWSYEAGKEAGKTYYKETLRALRRAADFKDAEDEPEAKVPAIGSRFIFHDVKKDGFEVVVAKTSPKTGKKMMFLLCSCVVCCHRTIPGETYTRLNSAS